MTLEQLMAFTVNPDHERQEQVWEALQRAYTKEPYHIRRLLTEGAVRASGKRAQFVGIAAYEAAGGMILRDLFEQDGGGWLQNPALLDRLVAQRLDCEAEAVRGEGWKWVEVATDFPYGYSDGLRRISGQPIALADEEHASREALRAEYDQLEATYAEADELPDEVDQRLGEIETALGAFEERPVAYAPEAITRAGAFVHIDGSGTLRVERGYVRPEDEPAAAEPEAEAPSGESDAEQHGVAETADAGVESDGADDPDDDAVKSLPDCLMTELTAHRTLALRQALDGRPNVAFLAMLHALCLNLFYRSASGSCLEIEAKRVVFGSQAPGLNDTPVAKALDERHRAWSERVPEDPSQLWDTLLGFAPESRMALFAHCAALTVNAVYEPWNRRPRALAHADRIAQAVNLDMAAAGWAATVENYLGRVTKARILQAVREARGESAAQTIAHLKKAEMAEQAQQLLAGTGWLPEPLRTPLQEPTQAADVNDVEPLGSSDLTDVAAAGQETIAIGADRPTEDEAAGTDSHTVAAE